jgi:hypothetical protein
MVAVAVSTYIPNWSSVSFGLHTRNPKSALSKKDVRAMEMSAALEIRIIRG